MKIDLTYTDVPTRQELQNGRVLDSRLVDKKIFCRKIENGYIVPYKGEEYMDCHGEIYDSDGKLIADVNANVSYANVDEVRTSMEVCAEQYKHCDDCVIYLGSIYTVYGHYITDGLSKAWFFDTEEYRQLKEKNIKIVFTPIWSNPTACPRPLRELYALLGVDVEIMPVNELTQFKEIYIPDCSLFMQDGKRVFAQEYRDTIRKIADAAPDVPHSAKYRKIYLSRSKWIDKNADFGEKAIEKVFKKCGYTILSPEKYPIAEQVAIYQQAESMVSTVGSISHNALFCREGAEVILLRKTWSNPDYQQMCNEVADLNVTFIDVHLSNFVSGTEPDLGPFFLYINGNLQRFIKDKFGKDVKTNFSVSKFLAYTRLCMKKSNVLDRFKHNPLPDYYYQKMFKEVQNVQTFKRCLFVCLFGMMETLGLAKLVKKTYYKYAR